MVARLTEGLPHVVTVHCMAHRFELKMLPVRILVARKSIAF